MLALGAMITNIYFILVVIDHNLNFHLTNTNIFDTDMQWITK